MKGVLGFLERAGLVRMEPPSPQDAPEPMAQAPTTPTPTADSASALTEGPAPQGSVALDWTALYLQAGVPPATYPAERLLRLIDGLSAMDEATRRVALRAMDEADESWTLKDPLDDAQAKADVLGHHGDRLAQELTALEHDIGLRLEQVQASSEQALGDIRRQIGELEALMAREATRAAQEVAALEALRTRAREQTAGQRAALQQQRRALLDLLTRYGVATEPSKA